MIDTIKEMQIFLMFVSIFTGSDKLANKSANTEAAGGFATTTSIDE